MSVNSSLNHLQAASVAGLSSSTRTVERAGAIAGLAGGIAMAIVGAMISFAIQESIWQTPKEIAAFLFGQAAAATPGFDAAPVIVGSLLHLALSALFGIGYALLISRVLRITTEYGAPVVGGLVYGLAIWLVAYFVVVPLLNPALLDAYAPSFIIQNLVYGTVVGLVYMVARPETYIYFVRPVRPSAPSTSAE
ncbi:MAG: hypothetical protein RLZZ387_5008 [Chloroflexota bacterium]|jgi:hypothetical protein